MLSWEKLIDPVIGLMITSTVLWIVRLFVKRLPTSLLQRKPAGRHIASEDLDRINRLYQGQAIVSGPFFKEPLVKERGAWQLDAQQQQASEDFRAQFKRGNIPNDPHAVITHAINTDDDPVSVEVMTLDYGALKALRQSLPNDQWPRVLSASALIVDPKGKNLILHRRAPQSATYAGYLHTIGGAYWPAMDGRDGDRESIRATALREVLEEINTAIDIQRETPLCLLEEVQTGFVQFIYLGCPIYETDYLKANAEGNFTFIPFDELEKLLTGGGTRIVPTGEAAVLLWLAMGAPGIEPEMRFAGRKPRQLFLDACNAREAMLATAAG